MEKEVATTQPRPAPLSQVYIHVLPKYILLEDGVMVYVNFPIREKFWPLHSN
jgi:hypothetical protein